MKYVDIEKIATGVLIGEKINTPAVMADRIAEFVCDLSFDWRVLDKCSPDGKVLAMIDVGNKTICLNESCKSELQSNPGRMNFTIAHELGHWFLHRDLAQARLPGFEGKILICRGIDCNTNSIERQANLFATYLLMPQSFVENAIRAFASPLTESDIKQLAAEFCVSKQAMLIRLVDELELLYPVDGLYYSKTEFLELGGQLKFDF